MDRADKFSRKGQIQRHISSFLVQKSGMRRQFSAIDSEMVLLWHRQAPEVPLAAFCIRAPSSEGSAPVARGSEEVEVIIWADVLM